MTNCRYGWKPSKPDHRDLTFRAPIDVMKALPPSVDLRPNMPPVYDQGDLGSCTANAVAGALEYDEIKEAKANIMPSRLFVYFNTRVLEHDWQTDAGAELRDVMKSINKWGYCDEALWPYDITKFAIPPSKEAYAAAWWHKISKYQAIPQIDIAMKSCLSMGYPFVIGFTVYESFESEAVATTGIVPMPGPTESVLGGHAVLVVGYDDSTSYWTVRNSWGPSWGQAGYFSMPYKYFLDPNLSSDLWQIIRV